MVHGDSNINTVQAQKVYESCGHQIGFDSVSYMVKAQKNIDILEHTD